MKEDVVVVCVNGVSRGRTAECESAQMHLTQDTRTDTFPLKRSCLPH